MRKALPSALLAVALIMLVLTSCASSSDSERILSEEDCAYTLSLVLQQATESAIPKMFLEMSEVRVSMVMSDYSFLNRLRYTIPGMDRLLLDWESAVSFATISNFDLFSTYVESIADGMVFQDPVGLVKAGNSSISEYLQTVQGQNMANVIKDNLSQLDVRPWRNVAVQYNSWATTRERLYGEKSPRIDAEMPDDEIVTLLSRHLVDVYIGYLRGEEMLIRTTPNANMDPVAAYVLGLE